MPLVFFLKQMKKVLGVLVAVSETLSQFGDGVVEPARPA
jgi:hypothetical protein